MSNLENKMKYILRGEHRQARQVMLTNHFGKLKKRKRTPNSENNHNRPLRQFVGKHSSFTNLAGSLGLSDIEYKEYLKTGKISKTPNNKDA
jgi:hypothetical protein